MIIKYKIKFMANSINTDKKKRKLFLKNFEKRNNLKKSIKNKNLTSFERYTAQIALQNMPRNSSKIRIKNRCILSGRTHGIVGPFNISRIKLRELASNGLITGMKKAIW
jgi:small subunit ribosomal protein S14|tara:strand:- start:258 stop:584 length:327 start_codon:yes stop_codon:yes gene_type:complete